MEPFSSFMTALFGCLFSMTCVTTPTTAHGISIETYSSSSPDVTIVTTVNGRTTRQVIPAPYGVKTSYYSDTIDGKTTSEASTTPLSQKDIYQMQQQIDAMQKDMDQMFADQEKMFQDMWNSFPQM